MINRTRTAFVSVTAVAVAMMVLGSNARAQSVSSLEKRASSLEKRASSLENQGKSLVGLLNRLEKRKPQTLTLYNKELSDLSMIQVNIHALVANQSALLANQSALLAMEANLPPASKKLKSIQKELNSIQKVLNSTQTRVVAETGVATPVRSSTTALATRDPKDSEVRNRGAQGARHTPRAARRSLIAEPGNN